MSIDLFRMFEHGLDSLISDSKEENEFFAFEEENKPKCKGFSEEEIDAILKLIEYDKSNRTWILKGTAKGTIDEINLQRAMEILG